jgi:outer membrane protein assembly factor BamB
VKNAFKARVFTIVATAVAAGLVMAAILQGFSPPRVARASAPNIVISGYPGPGDTITVSGSGWPARHILNISYDSQLMTTAVARFELGIRGQSTNLFQASLTIPTNTTVGNHTIQVVDPSTGLAQQAAIAVKAEWSQFGFTAAGARYNPYETSIGAGNVGQLTLAWSYNTGYTGAVMPTVAEDNLLIANQPANNLTNLNPMTGQQIWQKFVSAQSQEAVANGVVFVAETYFEARSIVTGNVLWASKYLPFYGSPVLANGLVYSTANTNNGTSYGLYAFAQNGMWTGDMRSALELHPNWWLYWHACCGRWICLSGRRSSLGD